jgi:hypothetical protein
MLQCSLSQRGTHDFLVLTYDEGDANITRFNPERWANPTKDMRDAFVAFGTGPRGTSAATEVWMDVERLRANCDK